MAIAEADADKTGKYEYSEQLLRYQRHGADEIIQDLAWEAGLTRHLAALTRPIVQRGQLKMSPYWQN